MSSFFFFFLWGRPHIFSHADNALLQTGLHETVVFLLNKNLVVKVTLVKCKCEVLEDTVRYQLLCIQVIQCNDFS